ncbi:MAG: cation diffusion facilitator family transporter, partial [Clostridiales bacterium]|nr:cation diffusion facilitator family transporter [Clostridiales bacterium]
MCGAVGIFFNTLLFAAKLFAGLITGTISVVADAFNNLTDAASSAVTTIGFSLSGRRADTEHPFGHGRIEYISGVFISVAIIFIGIELLRSSVSEIFSPSDTAPSPFMIPILIASVAIKLYMAAYNKKWGK